MFVVYGFVLQFLETFTILSKDGNLSLSFHDRSLNSPCKTESHLASFTTSAINNGCLETVCAVVLLTTPTSTSHVSLPLSSQPHKGLLLKRITGAKPGCSQRSMRQRKVRLHTTHSAKRRATVPDLMLVSMFIV